MVIPLTTDSNNTNSLRMSSISSSGATLRTFKVRTLRDLQRQTVIDMLHFGTFIEGGADGILGTMTADAATTSTPNETSVWKVLVLDATGQRILSPIMKVNDLRDHGVTLYLQLHSDRQAISDVPAVYFVEPTAENIGRISKDIAGGLYESFYLNFTSTIPRALLEDLAYNSVQTGSSALIAKVFDQYMNYVTLEDNLFSLSQPEAFVTLQDAASSETAIEGCLEAMTSGLFSVLLTGGGGSGGGHLPLIYAMRGTAAEALGERLERRLRTHLLNTKSTGTSASGGASSVRDTLQRPLLLLLDRTHDLGSPLRHTSTYNALVHDILGMRLNRVTIPDPSSPGAVKTFDIDMKDSFWWVNANQPFPTVAENVDVALNAYRADMQQVTRGGSGGIMATATSMTLENLDELNSSMMTAEELKTAITVLPELTERKRIIDCHLQISTALLEQIKARDLGNLFHAEQQSLGSTSPAKVVEILRGKEASPADKMRFFLVYYLAQEVEPSTSELALLEATLREAGCDMRSYEFVRRQRALQRRTAAQHASQIASGTGGPSQADFLQSLGGRLTGGVLGNVLSSVKNLLPEAADTPLTKLIDGALEAALGPTGGLRSTLTGTSSSPGGSGGRDDQFIVLDPRASAREREQRMRLPQRSAFNQLIVFIVGGSNYAEYNHVSDYLVRKHPNPGGNGGSKFSLTFGTTELVTAEEFLSQLARLGQ